jgi:hypothetical protein
MTEEIELDLSHKIFCVFGVNESGKTNWCKQLAYQYGTNAFVFDPHKDFDATKCDRWVPKRKFYPGTAWEIETIISKIRDRYKIAIIDEADQAFPNQKPFMPKFSEYFGSYRHFHCDSIGFVARRPVSLNTTIVELAKVLVIFRTTGKNDILYLNDIAHGLGDAAAALKDFHYILVNPDRSWAICEPIGL